MVESYGSGLPKHAIYNTSSSWMKYVIILAVSKFLRAAGLFLSYDLLKIIPVVQFLFIIKTGSSLPLLILQKPFSSSKRLSKSQWFRIGKHAVFGAFLSLLWLFGLTLCGPFRTILLFEHSDLVIISGASALFTANGGGPAKSRGAFFFLIAILTLLLFDHDEEHSHHDHDGNHKHSNVFTHVFYHIINSIGWSDHKGGVVLLSLTLFLQIGYNSASKKLSVDVGGSKRLHAMSTFIQAFIMFPWAMFIAMTKESDIDSWLYLLFPLFLVILFVLVIDFYIEAVVINHLQPPKTAVYGAYAIFLSALFFALTWNHPLVSKITTIKEIITNDHVLSGGVVFSLAVFMLATNMLAWPSKGTKGGSFIGYSATGLPLYSFTGDAISKTTHSVVTILKNGLKQIYEESDSRRIFYFLCINLCFTFVELVYGVWTNSLGLISDGFHMLFDCSALVMGLYAAIMSRWKATRIFSYGYDRVEVLSGFINGLFLVVIGIFVFTEGLSRLFHPPEIHTERLFAVSVMGLLVNLIGIVAFRGAHGHSHGGGHGHSHGGGGHGHSHGGGHNTNMEGVFLHILADTLGSVGVIISTVLIENFGWNIADPICSLFIATMILLSVLPLLKETSMILLLRSPSEEDSGINEVLQKVLNIEGILAYREPHFWQHTADKIYGTVHIHVVPDASEQKIIAYVTNLFKEININTVTVQVEKETYYFHLSGLGANCDSYNDFGNSKFFQNGQAIKDI
ncbi:solute carrier family 30 (zinc transporter), member 5/7 [Mytilus galloprovincialis]|uniref:Proton-coupled zinc antiporter SLC30A5 n=1 Tax=Mytilus galloprovincialis TaxID=29158 RepID=A0A8B6C3P3_MYTGA|nr:solute carrier family 30 (zinc transporter), member 5/7 [Mytilus galloprovincialis]